MQWERGEVGEGAQGLPPHFFDPAQFQPGPGGTSRRDQFRPNSLLGGQKTAPKFFCAIKKGATTSLRVQGWGERRRAGDTGNQEAEVDRGSEGGVVGWEKRGEGVDNRGAGMKRGKGEGRRLGGIRRNESSQPPFSCTQLPAGRAARDPRCDAPRGDRRSVDLPRRPGPHAPY